MERLTNNNHNMVILEKCEVVFKLLASHCSFKYSLEVLIHPQQKLYLTLRQAFALLKAAIPFTLILPEFSCQKGCKLSNCNLMYHIFNKRRL